MRTVLSSAAAGMLVVVCGCSGLATASRRNSEESVRVEHRGHAISEENVTFVLELRDTRRELSLGEIRASSSGLFTDVPRSVRSEIKKKEEKILRTLTAATLAGGNDVILLRPDENKAYESDNVVLYLTEPRGYRLYFSFDEIDQLFAVAVEEMQSDLETVDYRHPTHASSVIEALRAELERRDIRLDHATLSDDDVQALKIRTATAILETELRAIGVPLDPEKPIVKTGLLGGTGSPKITAALSDPGVLGRIASSDEPAVVRAFQYLFEEGVIKLQPEQAGGS